MVVSYDGEWATVQVGTKPLHGEDHSKAFLFSDRLIALGLAEGTAGISNNMFSIVVALNKNGTDADTTSIRLNFSWCGGIKMTEDRG